MFPSALPGLGAEGRGRDGVALAEEQYWDALVLGQPLPPKGVDPDAGEVIRQIHALDDAPLPDAAFAARLESQLLGKAPAALEPRAAIDPSAVALPQHLTAPTGWAMFTQRRVMNIAATAALLTLVLVSVFVTLRAGSRPPQDEGVFPLVLGPGITGETLLLQTRFDDYPDEALSPDIEGWVLQPGAQVSMGTEGSSGEGPSAYLVESGTLTVSSDGPIAVTRKGTLTPVPVAEPFEVALQTGDRGFAPSGVTSTWRNTGDGPVRVLEAAVKKRDDNLPYVDGVLNYTVIGDSSLVRREPPIVVSVFRITLQPEAVLNADTVSGLEMLKVEAGRLVAIDIDADGNAKPPVPLGQGTRSLGSFPPGRVFRSANDKPVSLLLVTIANTNPLRSGG